LCEVPTPQCYYYRFGTCVICNNGYWLHVDTTGTGLVGVCLPTPPLDIPNCLTFFWSYCATCSLGYSFSNNLCVPIANCATQSGITCSACNSGYTLLSIGNTACVPTVANCAQYTGASCLTCLSGYTLSGQPVFGVSSSSTSCNPSIPNCKTFNIDAQGVVYCSQCNSGYYFSDFNVCVASIPGCTKTDISEGCL